MPVVSDTCEETKLKPLHVAYGNCEETKLKPMPVVNGNCAIGEFMLMPVVKSNCEEEEVTLMPVVYGNCEEAEVRPMCVVCDFIGSYSSQLFCYSLLWLHMALGDLADLFVPGCFLQCHDNVPAVSKAPIMHKIGLYGL